MGCLSEPYGHVVGDTFVKFRFVYMLFYLCPDMNIASNIFELGPLFAQVSLHDNYTVSHLTFILLQFMNFYKLINISVIRTDFYKRPSRKYCKKLN